jgi:hypothetical protein
MRLIHRAGIRLSVFVAVLTGAIASSFAANDAIAQPGEALTFAQTIPLPDVRGRSDHLAIDIDGGRLFVAALGNNTVEVIDLRARRPAFRIGQLHEPQGVAYVPGAGRLIVANGEGGRVDIFAGKDFSPLAHVDALQDADNVRYEPGSGRIYVGYGNGALAVLDASTLKKTGDIKLAGHPESFQLDSKRSRIYVNVPSAQQIAVVDSRRASVVDTWAIADMRGNFPMALDLVDDRLFVVTRQPAALLVYDVTSGKRVASVPVCGDADDVFFDDKSRRLYLVCGEGVIDIVRQRDADHYDVTGRLPTVKGARTGLFVPTQGSLYVAVPAHQAAHAEIRVYQGQAK